MSPATAVDLEKCLEWAVSSHKAVVIRYPKSSCPTELKPFEEDIKEGEGVFIDSEEFAPTLSYELEESEKKNLVHKNKKVIFVTTGGMLAEVIQASRNLLMENVKADIYSLRFLKEIKTDSLIEKCMDYDAVIFVEDGVKEGGVSEILQKEFLEKGISNTIVKAFPTSFLPQGTREEILEDNKMDSRSLVKTALEVLKK